MPLLTTSDGSTPLSQEELADLIPKHLATKADLNEWEAENILLGKQWADFDKSSALEVISDAYVRKLHLRMFDETWKWAGDYRNTEKNIGVPFHEIRERLAVLVGDVNYWILHKTYPPDEIAIRFHHRLVQIHPFPNGNGRHGRLIADVLIKKLGGAVFSWGRKDLVKQGETRQEYLDAMRAADNGNIAPLLAFARS